MDNDASQAGIDEIKGHVDVLSARIKQLGNTPGNAPVATQLLEDLSDYYERGIQLRSYRVTSLEEELKESKEKETKATKVMARLQKIFCLIAILVLVAIVDWMYPETLGQLYRELTWSHLFCSIMTIVAIRILSK